MARFDAVVRHRASMDAVPPDANPIDDPADAATLARLAGALADAVEQTLAGWVERVVSERWRSWSGQPPSNELLAAARAAGERARDEILPELRALLATDVDAQRANPLALVRRAVGPATDVLAGAGVPEVVRDPHAQRIFPDDVYDLSPATFGDLAPSVHQPGLEWGAAKAHVVLARRRARP
jgi:hypothetical protein